MELVTEQLVEHFKVFLRHWAGYEVISGQRSEMTHSVEVPFSSERYLCVDQKYLEYIPNGPGAVWEYYIFRKDLERKTKRLRSLQ